MVQVTYRDSDWITRSLTPQLIDLLIFVLADSSGHALRMHVKDVRRVGPEFVSGLQAKVSHAFSEGGSAEEISTRWSCVGKINHLMRFLAYFKKRFRYI